MVGDSDLEMFFRHRSSADVDESVARYILGRLSKHCMENSTLPVAFVRDAGQPLFYERVRDAFVRSSKGTGVYHAEIKGKKYTFRVEDRGESFVTLYPLPEKEGYLVPLVELVVSEYPPLALLPYGC